jgi:hypothetical protein
MVLRSGKPLQPHRRVHSPLPSSCKQGIREASSRMAEEVRLRSVSDSLRASIACPSPPGTCPIRGEGHVSRSFESPSFQRPLTIVWRSRLPVKLPRCEAERMEEGQRPWGVREWSSPTLMEWGKTIPSYESGCGSRGLSSIRFHPRSNDGRWHPARE